MGTLLQKVLGENREKETRTYKVTARPDHLDLIEALFAWINSTRSGHSGAAEIYVDGDGAARVDIERVGGEIKKFDEDEDAYLTHRSKGPEFKVGLE